MIKYQKNIFKYILVFSVVINVFLLGILFLVLRDSLSQEGDYRLEGKSFWYFVGIVAAYCLGNIYFLIQFFKKAVEVEPEILTEE
jgi:hypothetical protein